MKLGWLKRRFKTIDRTWWYVGYAVAVNNHMECCGMIYTLTTPEFVLPAVQKDLERILKVDCLTILSWQQLKPAEGANLAKYFQARKNELLAKAKAGEPVKPSPSYLSLVKMDDQESK